MLRGFLGIFRFDERLEIVEAHGPEAAVLLEPGVDSAQRFWIEVIDPMAPLAMLADEMRAAQQPQVTGDGRSRYRKCLSDRSGGLAATPQQIEDGAAGGIGDGLERGVLGLEGRICNRMVPHNV